MATIDVTITDVTKGPFRVLDLFSLTPPTGVTVVPTASSSLPLGAPRIAAQLSVQANGANGAALIYWGDKNLTPATSEKGITLPAYGSNTKRNVPLAGEYVNASANSAVLTIAADGGFQ